MSWVFTYNGESKPSYFCQGWGNKEDAQRWDSVKEAIKWLTNYWSSQGSRGNTSWTQKDLQEWMVDQKIELEYI